MQYTEKYISLNIQLISGIFIYEIYKNMKVNSATHMSFCKEKCNKSEKLLFTWMIIF